MLKEQWSICCILKTQPTEKSLLLSGKIKQIHAQHTNYVYGWFVVELTNLTREALIDWFEYKLQKVTFFTKSYGFGYVQLILRDILIKT